MISRRGVRGRLLPLVLTALLGAGCASTGDAGDSRDPFESFNRKVHSFNTALDEAILAPVARGYRDNVNPVFRYSVRSFFSNLEDVWTGANNLLQGKPVAAVRDATRVLLNTTFGFLGLADPASEMGFPKQREDFGQTLGVWGVPAGPYIVLPFFGPSSGRDAVGFGVDSFGDPLPEIFEVTSDQVGARAFRIVDTRESLLDASRLLPGIALDEYSFIRDAYLQRRRSLVYDGDPPWDDEPGPKDDGWGDDPSPKPGD